MVRRTIFSSDFQYEIKENKPWNKAIAAVHYEA